MADFGWFRDTSDNKLVAAADSDLTPPAGHDFILKSTIEAAYTGEIWQLGTWDGTTYTPPADILVAFDPLVGAGIVKKAAHDALDVLETGAAYLVANGYLWDDKFRAAATDGIHWMIINMARIALNSVRTASYRQKFCEEVGSWPTGVNGEVRQYIDAIEKDSVVPTGQYSWVSHADAQPTRTDYNGAR